MNLDNLSKKIIFALLISVLAVSVAIASNLSQAKADGYIGEQPNGYLGLVDNSAPANIKSLVANVNAKRKAGYEKIARKQGTSLGEVEKVGGKTALEKTLQGNYIRSSDGRWSKK